MESWGAQQGMINIFNESALSHITMVSHENNEIRPSNLAHVRVLGASVDWLTSDLSRSLTLARLSVECGSD